jgi:hypothetical protein
MLDTADSTPARSEEAAQAELRALARAYETLNETLRHLAARLPVSPQEEEMLLGQQEPDVSTEIRRVVDCLLEDRLVPAVEEIKELAEYRPGAANLGAALPRVPARLQSGSQQRDMGGAPTSHSRALSCGPLNSLPEESKP